MFSPCLYSPVKNSGELVVTEEVLILPPLLDPLLDIVMDEDLEGFAGDEGNCRDGESLKKEGTER